MKQKIGTFNCQGILTTAANQQMLVNDFELYKMSVLAIQEMHIKGYGTMKHQIPVKDTYFIIPAVKKNQKTELASSYHLM